jgi:hypothetical protein
MGIEKPHRRAVVAGGAALFGTLGIESALRKSASQKESVDFNTLEQVDARSIHHLRAQGLAVLYTRRQEGARFPESFETSFPENLKDLWNLKIERMKRHGRKDAEVEAMISWGARLVEDYARHFAHGAAGKGSFIRMLDDLTQIENGTVKATDWQKLHDEYGGVSALDVQMLAAFAARTNGRALLAYGMTEVIPYTGKNGIAFTDFLLKNAGQDFLLKIPSLGDDIPSVSFTQMTNIGLRGAKRAAVGLPERFALPSNVEALETLEDHTRATLFHGMNVLLGGIRKARIEGGGQSLENLKNLRGADFAAILGAYHYRPADATEALGRWLKSDRYEAYASYCPQEVRTYASKTATNYEAIEVAYPR